MVKIRKYANGIERFLHGEKGQRFFNFAYSIGAAVVIWGALFKILHLPGGSTLLCIGMGTEIAMFILTAFDRPPKEYSWEDVFPVLDSHNAEDRPDFVGGTGVVINGGVPTTALAEGEYSAGGAADTPSEIVVNPAAQLSDATSLAEASKDYLEQMQGISEQMARLNETTEALNEVTRTLLTSYQAITQNSESISGNSQGYVSQMQDLNRNIAGLNTIYEIQLKSVSSQLESIDRVNRGLKDIRDMYDKAANESSRYCEETEKMARYMKQLNSVYEKMITAMTINMQSPMMGRAAGNAGPFDETNNTQNL
ncbi:MAG: gliding motility protein GldL [Candidatus Amulumruptor caecigallinarius]|nr:gliding motility protein GldL [Candidatus Amulumruptor caecigallinarius]